MKLIALALALIYIVWCIFSIGVTPSEKEASGKFGSLKEVISKRGNWYICVFNWVNFGLFYVVQTVIGKKYLEDFANMTPSRAALVFSIFFAILFFYLHHFFRYSELLAFAAADAEGDDLAG